MDRERQRPVSSRSGVVVVGSGFGGFFAARRLRRLRVDVTVLAATDSFLYTPLLPDVAVGTVDPRSVLIPLASTLRGVTIVRGQADRVDLNSQTVHYTDARGQQAELGYRRLLLAPGSVTKLLPIPGLSDHAIGLKTATEALYLREKVLAQLEAATTITDAARRREALTFVVVGAGYAGVELTAQMARLAHNLVPLYPGVTRDDVRWLLVDVADEVMPELGGSLGRSALRLLRRRGVDVRLGISVERVRDHEVALTDGTRVRCGTLVWCAGVVGNPMIEALGLPTVKGRLVVDKVLRVPQHHDVYAIGDAAAVPDLTKPQDEHGQRPLCPPHCPTCHAASDRRRPQHCGRPGWTPFTALPAPRPWSGGRPGRTRCCGDASRVPAAGAAREGSDPRVPPVRPADREAPNSGRRGLGHCRQAARRRLFALTAPIGCLDRERRGRGSGGLLAGFGYPAQRPQVMLGRFARRAGEFSERIGHPFARQDGHALQNLGDGRSPALHHAIEQVLAGRCQRQGQMATIGRVVLAVQQTVGDQAVARPGRVRGMDAHGRGQCGEVQGAQAGHDDQCTKLRRRQIRAGLLDGLGGHAHQCLRRRENPIDLKGKLASLERSFGLTRHGARMTQSLRTCKRRTRGAGEPAPGAALGRVVLAQAIAPASTRAVPPRIRSRQATSS